MQVGRRIAVATRRPALLLAVVSFGVLLVDQLTKAAIRVSMQPSETIPLLDEVFHLTYVRNTGAAFGLMPGRMPLFVATSSVVVVSIAVYWFWLRPRARWLVMSLGLVLGGAIGNLVDRVSMGRVTDFFDFRFFPVFNIADTAIVVGVGMLMIWILFEPQSSITPDALPEDDLPAPEVLDPQGPTGGAEL